MSFRSKYTIYTDGACSGNPGPGGWGAVIQHNQDNHVVETIEISGGVEKTTNNRMELTAAISALKSLTQSTSVLMYTDSRYVCDGITSWIKSWKRNSWRRGNAPVKNIDLWKQLDDLNQFHTIRWEWVKGHAKNTGNNRADELATGAIPVSSS